MESLQIIHGDCVDQTKLLASESIHLVVTSPPYDDLRTYGSDETPEWNFFVLAPELFRVLAPGGMVCWNVGDSVAKGGGETLTSMRQAIHFVDVCGFRMHDTMIWHKLNFSSPAFTRYHHASSMCSSSRRASHAASTRSRTNPIPRPDA